LLLAYLFQSAVAAAQEIWLVPQANVIDLQEMFTPTAPWRNAASHTNVFGVYGNPFLNPVPQQQLNVMMSDLNRRGIVTAVETGVMNVPAKPRPPCGGWGYVEGYGPVALHRLLARKLLIAGANVKYIAMDEPLYFGHYFKGRPNGQPGCQSSLKEVAALVAPSLQEYIKAFAAIQIGDTEPAAIADDTVGCCEGAKWRDDLLQWVNDFRSATGRPLAFLQIDVGWSQPDAVRRARALYDFANILKQRNFIGSIGIIFNGNPTDGSDAAWMQSARAHMKLMEGDFALRPGQVIIQSWQTKPSHAMPESSPEALTSLVNFYTAHPWAD
jgi:hypothetical protein